MTHPLDAALQAGLPPVVVPRFGPFEPLTAVGERLLLAAGCQMIEVRRTWLYARVVCGVLAPGFRAPYGEIGEVWELPRGPLPKALLEDFIVAARAALPNEVAARILLDTRRAAYELQLLPARSASAAHVDYEAPPIPPEKELVIDVHSHGHLRAGFSPQDDLDDAGSTQFAIVIGKLHLPTPDVAARLTLRGLHFPIPFQV